MNMEMTRETNDDLTIWPPIPAGPVSRQPELHGLAAASPWLQRRVPGGGVHGRAQYRVEEAQEEWRNTLIILSQI